MNEDKIFVGLGYMKNILYLQVTICGTNNSITNLVNSHTYSTSCADLINTIVLVMDRELKITDDMAGCARVGEFVSMW